jgi:integrase
MSSKRKSFVVTRGNRHVTVYPWVHPATKALRWRFPWRENETSPWRYVTRKTKDEASAAAEKWLETQPDEIAFALLPSARRRWLETIQREVAAADEAKVLVFIASLQKSAEITAAVARFCLLLRSKAGEETPHHRRVRSILEAMAAHFAPRAVVEIHLEALEAWYGDRCAGLGWKRKRDIRAALVQFWRWARKEGIGGNDVITTGERLPEVASEVYDQTVVTLKQLEHLGRQILPKFRAWLVLGAFSGMRPEEIAPPVGKAKKRHKRGLNIEEIDWQFSCIRLPKCVAKGGKRARLIPLNDACKAGLEWAGIRPGMTGPVCNGNPAKEGELKRLGEAVFGGEWPKDILRHSYGSYRNSELRDLATVAEEMGTSENMLHASYHNPRAEAEGKAYFATRFGGDPICSDETDVNVRGTQSLTA